MIGENRLLGVIFDAACKLHEYAMNRDAREFEFFRFLVDGSHWQAQKKFKGKSRSIKGHLGCSEGFNFNQYKTHLPNGINSQGREQMHAQLEKCIQSGSLRQMTYRNYMTFIRVWFSINNLKNTGKLD